MPKRKKSQWVLEPGERYSLDQKIEQLVATYESENKNKNFIVASDNEQGIVYFMSLTGEGVITSADVAILLKDNYAFMPKTHADELAEAFLNYTRLLVDAKDHMEESWGA